MKIGLVITTFDRFDCLKETLDSVSQSYLPKGLEVFVVDDGSKDGRIKPLIQKFSLKDIKIVKLFHEKNSKTMSTGLKEGFSHFLTNGFDIMVNLDSDMIVKPYWLSVLLKLYNMFPQYIISGFNNMSQNPALETFPLYNTKNMAGGVNFMFGRDTCEDVLSSLVDNAWDDRLGKIMRAKNKPYIVSRPSVMQHLGAYSGLNRSGALAEDYNCSY